MKQLAKFSLTAAVALSMLAGCGLRGDLERPDPLFQEKKEVVEVTKVEPTPTVTRVVRNTRPTTTIRRNADGGVIPKASPSTPVSEGGLDDIQ